MMAYVHLSGAVVAQAGRNGRTGQMPCGSGQRAAERKSARREDWRRIGRNWMPRSLCHRTGIM